MAMLTLLKRNIQHKKGSFISIAILMCILTMSLVSIISTYDNQEQTLDYAIQRSDMGDIMCLIKEVDYHPEIIDTLHANKEVKKIEDIASIALYKVKIKDTESSNMLMAVPYTNLESRYPLIDETNNQYQKHVQSLKTGEVYLPLGMKALFHCNVGDSMVITTSVGKETFVIKGFVEEPMLGAYFMGVKQIFISQEDSEHFTTLLDTLPTTLNNEKAKMENYHILQIYQRESSHLTSAEFQKQINKETSILDYTRLSLTKLASMNYTLIANNTFNGILYAFIILLLIIVCIVIGHSITTSIEMDYVDLGILKSQGLTKQGMQLLFMIQYVLAILLGSILGFALAFPLTKILAQTFQPLTGILTTSMISFNKSLWIIGSVIFMFCLYIAIKTRKVGKISPIQAIMKRGSEHHFDSRLQIPINQRAMNLKLSIRQLTTNKRQYLGTTTIVTILLFFMMSMTILTNSMSTESFVESMGYFNPDIEIELKPNFNTENIREIKSLIEEDSSIVQQRYSASRYFTLEGMKYNTMIFENPNTITGVLEGRVPLYENEIVISEIVSEEIGKSIGDTVTISYQGKSSQYMISGLVQLTNDVGRTFAMSLDGANKVSSLSLQWGEIAIKDTNKISTIITKINEQFGDIVTAKTSDPTQTMEMMKMAIDTITIFIYFISIIFMMVTIHLVCSKMFLKEKKDIGILKSMGFTSKLLKIQFALRFVFVSIIGSIIGTVFCLLLNNQMMILLLKNVGITNFKSLLSTTTIIIPLLILCICAFIFSYLASRKVKQVEVKELITE